jgi:hypothetical protein
MLKRQVLCAHIDNTLMKLKENYGIAEYACSRKPRHSHLNFTQSSACLRIIGGTDHH